MHDASRPGSHDTDPAETAEWRESLASVVQHAGRERAGSILDAVLDQARTLGVAAPHRLSSPYINTIAPHEEPDYPGDPALEQQIRRILRWNAMAMVVRANKRFDGIGGHLSTFASSAMLYEVGFNHIFKGKDAPGGGDHLFIQGHASPGIYARAFLDGRLSEDQLDRFRREIGGKGLSSYPHPWLMPTFWEHPTVSMGLGAIGAIYQARFDRYLHNRGLADTANNRVYAFLGDGECDEPESLGALQIASREGLDNLVFVINCNLQRLDGPVRGNGKIMQDLESVFRGAGWHVIKVVWSEDWDPLFAADREGLLVDRMNEVVDGQFLKYVVEPGSYMRQDFFGVDDRLLSMVEHLSDEQLWGLRRGGHSYRKVYAAYDAALRHRGSPVVILAKTVKGWGLGNGFEASNVTHQKKKLEQHELANLRDRLELDISDAQLEEVPFYHPGQKSPEVEYLLERRRALGGHVPERRAKPVSMQVPKDDFFAEFVTGTSGKVEVSTTMAMVRILRKLLRDKQLGKHVVPIVPDEARTFGMESLFREVGIYAPFGQKYEPVDAKMLLSYKESRDGQILEEGITEAGSMASFTAAATSYATHGVPTIPFYLFYSMFGMQRTGDQVWALGDNRGRGFLCGATAGRTTLNGEGLQHEDGHSHIIANCVPNCRAYDPTFAYEVGVIVRDGLRRMLEQNEDVFYYLSLYNENYLMPAMPETDGVEEGILRGMYRLRTAANGAPKPAKKTSKKGAPQKAKVVQILGSGPLLHAALRAQDILAEQFGVAADVWSVTSYTELYRDARRVERHNRLHPSQEAHVPFVTQVLQGSQGPVVATSDWVSELPGLLSRFIPNRFVPLGTNGYGRSDTREALRRFFEVDAEHVVVAALWGLCQEGQLEAKVVERAIADFGIDADAPDPMSI